MKQDGAGANLQASFRTAGGEGLLWDSNLPPDGGPDFEAMTGESGSVLWFGHQGSFYTCKSPSGRVTERHTKGPRYTQENLDTGRSTGAQPPPPPHTHTETYSIERQAQKGIQDLGMATTPSLMSGSQDVLVPTLQPLPAPLRLR